LEEPVIPAKPCHHLVRSQGSDYCTSGISGRYRFCPAYHRTQPFDAKADGQLSHEL